MKSLIFICILLFCNPTFSSAPEAEWRFCGMKHGVWFSWQLDDEWNMLSIKAHNKGPSMVKYTYTLLVYDGDKLVHQQPYRFTMLKSKKSNKFNVGRSFNYVSRVVLKELDVRIDN